MLWVGLAAIAAFLVWRWRRRSEPTVASEADLTDIMAAMKGNRGPAVTTTPVSGDIEGMAESLIAGHLPPRFLTDVDLSKDEGKALLLVLLFARTSQASLEKDEIVAFVERNRRVLDRGGFEIFDDFAGAAGAADETGAYGEFFAYVREAVRHAYERHPERIDIKSDRLLWLVYAASLAIGSGQANYGDAVTILRNPKHAQRISPLTLRFMLQDFAEAIGTPQQARPEYVALIAECGLISGDVKAVHAAAGLLAKLPMMRDGAAQADLLQRVIAFLAKHGIQDDLIQSASARLKQRTERIRDEDF